MVPKSESQKLARASVGAMAGVFLSRLSGIVRTFVINSSFGVGLSLDAFNVAFRFPNSLRDLFADGALSAAFIKVFVDEGAQGQNAERRLIAMTLGFFLVVTTTLALVGMLWAQPFIFALSSESFRARGGVVLGAHLFQMLVFYLPLTMLNAVFMGILGVRGMTFRAMNGSLCLSLGMILGALVLSPLCEHVGTAPIYGLAVGALLGAFLQLVYQCWPLRKEGYLPWPVFSPRQWLSYPPLRRMLLLMGPRALGQGALTLALLINTMFALEVGEGVLTYIVTAVMIIQVPVGLFGVASGFAAQPVLTRTVLSKNYTLFSSLLSESLMSTLWLAFLTTIGFALFIVPFYYLTFQHGKIHFHDTLQNALAVCAYSMGILFSSGSKVLLNAFYAINSTRVVVYNACIYLCVSAALTSFLAPRLGILGLGLSYAAATSCDFFLNLYFLRRFFKQLTNGVSPFVAAGAGFWLKILCFAMLSYAVGLAGFWSVGAFWAHFKEWTSVSLSFFSCLVLLGGGGAIFGILSLVLLLRFAPEPLRQLISRGLRVLRRRR